MSETVKDAGSRPEVTRMVTRGVMRLFRTQGEACLDELTLKTGRRVDVMALDRKGRFTAIEVKSSREDFRVDEKWQDYLPFCDLFYFAVSPEFPLELLPEDVGLIIADAYGAEVIRPATPGEMNPSRRKALTLRFARKSADRLMRELDPGLKALLRE